MAQLKENIDAFSVQLSDEANDKIADVFTRYPMPF